ncbi:unnamed protein product [Debaryomyces fabryi]|nr:unnamed protein product [Debaryomyces fabryi]
MNMTYKNHNDKTFLVHSNASKDANPNSDIEGNFITSIRSPQTGKFVNITDDTDIALNYIADENVLNIDEATNRRILRKIDRYLMPLMCLLYCFQFIDKMSNSFASIMGMREDLNMVGDQYSWSGTSFYLGYLVFEFPVSLLLQRFPVAKTVSVFIIIWGFILCMHSVPQYAGFIALRTILGMLESAVTPAFVILTSQWYKKEEQFIRTALWFGCNGIGQIIGAGAISYNLFVNADSYSIEAWKLLFIITGVLTIALGFVVMVHIPDTPTKAWFLSDEEKTLVVERIRSNQQGFGNKNFKKDQFIEAVTDIQTWFFAIFTIANNIPNGAVTNFSSILISGMGYSLSESLLMQMPQGACMTCGCIGIACGTLLFPYRIFWGALGVSISIIGSCMLSFAGPHKAQFAGLCLWNVGPVGFICLLSIIASNTAGHTKKITVNAINLIAYCVGNLIGPQTFIEAQAPGYAGGKIAIVVCTLVALCMLFCIWFVFWSRNKKLDANLTTKVENLEFADLTDKQNPNFRYAL